MTNDVNVTAEAVHLIKRLEAHITEAAPHVYEAALERVVADAWVGLGAGLAWFAMAAATVVAHRKLSARREKRNAAARKAREDARRELPEREQENLRRYPSLYDYLLPAAPPRDPLDPAPAVVGAVAFAIIGVFCCALSLTNLLAPHFKAIERIAELLR